MKEEVKRWWNTAKDDLTKAKILFNSKKYDGAVFFCQQSAEKALKSLLIQKTGDFPKIHDLTKLSRLAKAPQNIIESCSKINPAYTASRYPDSPKKYSKKESKETIKYVKEVLKWTKENL